MEQDSNKWPERGNNLTALTPYEKVLQLSIRSILKSAEITQGKDSIFLSNLTYYFSSFQKLYTQNKLH